jgi:hypothetical protein
MKPELTYHYKSFAPQYGKKAFEALAKINLFLLVSSKVASSTGGKANYFIGT